MKQLYHLRITREEIDLVSLIQYFDKDEKYLIVKHTPDDSEKQKHFHMMFFSKYTMSGIRSFLRNKLHLDGNGAFSFKKGTDLGFQYISHEGSECVISHKCNYDELHALSVSYKKDLKQAIRKNKGKSLYSRVFEYYDKFVKNENYCKEFPFGVSERHIAKTILKQCMEFNLRIPNKFQAQSIIQTIGHRFAHNVEDYENQLIASWIS